MLCYVMYDMLCYVVLCCVVLCNVMYVYMYVYVYIFFLEWVAYTVGSMQPFSVGAACQVGRKIC